jgi:hypothetical protein
MDIHIIIRHVVAMQPTLELVPGIDKSCNATCAAGALAQRIEGCWQAFREGLARITGKTNCLKNKGSPSMAYALPEVTWQQPRESHENRGLSRADIRRSC